MTGLSHKKSYHGGKCWKLKQLFEKCMEHIFKKYNVTSYSDGRKQTNKSGHKQLY